MRCTLVDLCSLHAELVASTPADATAELPAFPDVFALGGIEERLRECAAAAGGSLSLNASGSTSSGQGNADELAGSLAAKLTAYARAVVVLVTREGDAPHALLSAFLARRLQPHPAPVASSEPRLKLRKSKNHSAAKEGETSGSHDDNAWRAGELSLHPASVMCPTELGSPVAAQAGAAAGRRHGAHSAAPLSAHARDDAAVTAQHGVCVGCGDPLKGGALGLGGLGGMLFGGLDRNYAPCRVLDRLLCRRHCHNDTHLLIPVSVARALSKASARPRV